MGKALEKSKNYYQVLECVDGSRWTFRLANEKSKYIHLRKNYK